MDIQRPITGVTNRAALETRCGLLARHVPSVGGTVTRAVVTLETGAAEQDATLERALVRTVDEAVVRHLVTTLSS